MQGILAALQQNGVNGLLAAAQPSPFQAPPPFWGGRNHEGCRRGLTQIPGQGIFGSGPQVGPNPFFDPQNGPFAQQNGPFNPQFGPNPPQFVPSSPQFNPSSPSFPTPQPTNTFGPRQTAPISNVPATGSAISPIQ